MFSGFYLALFIVLTALIVRGVSFEFRNKRDSARWRVGWDWAMAVGSLLPAFACGPGPSLTIWSAASAHETLLVMTVVATRHLPGTDHHAAFGEQALQLAGLPDAAVGGCEPQVPLHLASPFHRSAARCCPATQASSTCVLWTWMYRAVVPVQA